jgi:hypothetical protein
MKINPIEINEINNGYNGLVKSKQAIHSINTPSTPSTNCLASSAGSNNLSKQAASSPTSSLFNENLPPRGKLKSINNNNNNNSNYLDIFSYHDKISELINDTIEQKRINKRKQAADRRSYYDNQDQSATNRPNDIELLLVEGISFLNISF